MKPVFLPSYAADELLAPRTNPSKAPDAIERSERRKFRLIATALEGLPNAQWRIDNEPKYRSARLDEFYGLERFDYGYCMYASERGIPSMLAIFERIDLAADYFVWIVSRGERKIDWSLFLEMEP